MAMADGDRVALRRPSGRRGGAPLYCLARVVALRLKSGPRVREALDDGVPGARDVGRRVGDPRRRRGVLPRSDALDVRGVRAALVDKDRSPTSRVTTLLRSLGLESCICWGTKTEHQFSRGYRPATCSPGFMRLGE